jgi:hypothetical protein
MDIKHFAKNILHSEFSSFVRYVKYKLQIRYSVQPVPRNESISGKQANKFKNIWKDKDRLQADWSTKFNTYPLQLIQLNNVMGRGSNNLNYDDGFKYERKL